MQAANQFVHGSWVKLRSGASHSVPVLGQLRINTPVTRMGAASAAGFCEVDDGKGLPPWTTLQALAARNPPGEAHSVSYNEVQALHLNWGWRDHPYELLRSLKLPAVPPSWFKRQMTSANRTPAPSS